MDGSGFVVVDNGPLTRIVHCPSGKELSWVGTGKILGTVTNADDPVPYAYVTLREASTRQVLWQRQADSDGEYAFTGLYVGIPFSLEAWDPLDITLGGYAHDVLASDAGTTADIDLAAGSAPTPTHLISGTVTRAGDAAQASILVTRSDTGEALTTTTSDPDTGDYEATFAYSGLVDVIAVQGGNVRRRTHQIPEAIV